MDRKLLRQDEPLLDYLDGTLTEVQRQEIEQRLKMSPALQSRFDELKLIHDTLLAKGALETPSDQFTDRVLRNLNSFQLQRFSARNGILLLLGILTAISVALLLLQSGVFDSLNGAVSIDSLPIKKEWLKIPLPSIPYSGKMMVNIVLIVATGLSFILLDRTILRPWFSARTQRG